MRVIDLAEEHEPLYFLCLEDWSDEMREAGDHKARWYERMQDQGLRVKLAVDDTGRVGGMIQYLPIERAPAVGFGLHFILCIWVHGHARGRGDFQGQGMGTALLEAAEADARALGADSMAAWGLAIPAWMRASWFRRHGYRVADRRGISTLVWKPFRSDAVAPRWPPRTRKVPEPARGKVVVTACMSGWCPAQNLALERARKAAEPLGDRAEIKVVDTSDRAEMLAWGRDYALFVDRREIPTGPPPSRERLARVLRRRAARLGA
jgi:GNAT superfamily N-acetyltransferase